MRFMSALVSVVDFRSFRFCFWDLWANRWLVNWSVSLSG